MRLNRWCVLVLTAATCATAHARQSGIVADQSVTPLDLTALVALDPAVLWKELDDAQFWAVPRDPPADYYAPIDRTNAAALRHSLHERIAGHHVVPYTHSSRPGSASHRVDVWDVVALADAHPEHPNRVLDLYQNGTFDRQLSGPTSNPRYDREHSWPKSLGFPDQNPANAAYSDCHHLFAAYQSYNASRSNKPYGEADPDAEFRRTTVENTNRGGALMDEPESSNYSFRDRFQVWMGRRGDAARAMFYMDVRYDGGENEPDLVLTADAGQVTARDVWQSGGQAFMGLLPVLIKWHNEDPVDDLERRRNGVVFLFQGNRNPFVDHPEWVGPVFAGSPVPTGGGGSGGSGGGGPGSAGGGLAVWINEFHYDDEGGDEGEFVEVCGTAGLSLSGWSVVGYNGAGGRAYETVPLVGAIPDQSGGFGAVAVNFVGLQNGAPDGIALVDPSGRVVELISYEGRFSAADGPAEGTVAQDVQADETGSTPEGHSIQRRGQGRTASAFAWHGPAPASRGRINDGQTFP